MRAGASKNRENQVRLGRRWSQLRCNHLIHSTFSDARTAPSHARGAGIIYHILLGAVVAANRRCAQRGGFGHVNRAARVRGGHTCVER